MSLVTELTDVVGYVTVNELQVLGTAIVRCSLKVP